MKLSGAIILGSVLSKQGFGAMSVFSADRCAWGAARQALGMKSTDKWPMEWDWTDCKMTHCPACGEYSRVAFIISDHLNDDHRWSRERIASWVASIEPSTPVQVEGRAPEQT